MVHIKKIFTAPNTRLAQNRSRWTKVRLCAVLSSPHLGQGLFASQNPITCPKRHIQPECKRNWT